MQEKNKLIQEVELVAGIKMLAEAYEEISVIKMQTARTSVLKTRDFLDELSDVFHDVKDSYKRQIVALLKQKKQQGIVSFSTLSKNNKSVLVFISSNAKLYGDIVHRVFQLFSQDVDNSTADIVIVGKSGKEYFDQRLTKKPYRYYEIPDTDAKLLDITELIQHILSFEKVTVYYGKFLNIVTQTPTASDISGESAMQAASATAANTTAPTTETKFLFEPSLEKILHFFETQIFTSLFKQTVHESELSRYASRIKAMEEALENINGEIGKLNGQKKRLKNMVMNKKQLEMISGMSLWRK